MESPLYKAFKDNKASGRGRETFEFFEQIDSCFAFGDIVSPKFVSQTVFSVANEDDEILRLSEDPSPSGMDLNSNPDQSKAESNPIQSQMSKGKQKAVDKPSQ